MTEDPIVAEVRKARHEHAARFHFDLDAIVADLRKRQAASGRKVVCLPPKRVPVAGVKKARKHAAKTYAAHAGA